MGKQNKNPGKRWQELLGLSAVPYFGQDTIPYEDEDEEEFIFNPETMSLINPIDIESGLYNKNAFEEGLYTPMYDEEGVFLGYAYNNDDFAYLDAFLIDQNYSILEGNVSINEEKQQVTARAVSAFISTEFTESENYELTFTYEVNASSTYRNMILFGFDEEHLDGYQFGIDIPSTTGLCIETFKDGEVDTREKYANKGFGDGIYNIKIIRDGTEATIYINDEELDTIDNIEHNTLGLWKWQNGSSSIRDIFIKDTTEPVVEPETVNISVTVTDGKDPIESVSVSLTDTNNNVVKTGTTGSAGGCTLSSVELGTYTVTASASGYTEYTDSLTVTNETTTLAITMSVAEVLEENPNLTP